MLVLYCIGLVWVGLVWSGLVCCVALPWVALPWPARREAEPERRAERSRISQCCQRNRNSRATAHDRLGSARRGKTRGSGQRAAGSGQRAGQRAEQSARQKRNKHLGTRCTALAPPNHTLRCLPRCPHPRRPPAARSPPARHSWLMAGLVWSLADASCVAVANNGFSAQLFLEPGVQVTRLTPVAQMPPPTVRRPPSYPLPIHVLLSARYRPCPNMPIAVAVAVAVSIPYPSIRCLVGPGPGPDHDPRAILGAERNRPRLPLPTLPLPTLPPPTLPPR
jgi:hypothetical protein